MKKLSLLIACLSMALVIGGVVSAYKFINVDDMTQEEKDFRIQALEIQQNTIQNQISYLKGEITQEEYEQGMEQNKDEMKLLREQMMEEMEAGNSNGCLYGKRHFSGFGRGMMRWRIK